MRPPSISIDYDGELWLLSFDGHLVEAYNYWEEAVDDIKPKLRGWLAAAIGAAKAEGRKKKESNQ